jgi:hypothetical protein
MAALGYRSGTPVVAVDAGGFCGDIRIDSGKIMPTAQHLLAIKVLGGVIRDKS